MSSFEADLLIALARDGFTTLQSQIERQILAAVRSGSLRPGTAARRELALEFLSRHYLRSSEAPTTLLLGYARSPESVIRTGIRALAGALRDIRQ